jgi:hypothetical protein
VALPAKYRGQCVECGEWFEPGESIEYNRGREIVHEHCPDPVTGLRLDAREPLGPLCGKCFCYHHGECV